jgi:sn-glycerol 3-phosphate transport system substrate-binding protein
MKRWVLHIIISVLLLLPGLLFAGGSQEPPDLTGAVSVDMWHAMSGARIELIEGIVQEFMDQNPNINVVVQYTGSYNDTLNKTTAAAKAGNAPHVFHLYEIGTLGMANSGMVVPIEDLSKWETIDWDAFFSPVGTYYTISGAHYSMPFNSSTPLLYYNKNFFQQVGLPDKAPATFDDVIEYSKKLMGSSLGLKGAITWNLHDWYFEEFHCIMDAPFVNKDNGRKGEFPTEVLFNRAPGQKVLEWWTGMERDGYFLDVGGPAWTNHRAALGSGEVAMIMSSTSDVNQLTGLLKEKDWELGTGFMPRPEGAKGGVTIGGGTLWLSAGHPDAETYAAFKLVKYISEDDAQMKWHKGTGYFAVRKTAMEKLESEGWFNDNPNFRIAFNQLLESPYTVNTAGSLIGVFPEVRALIETGVQKVYAGDATVKQALDEAAAKANQAIKEWNELNM